MLLFIPRSPVTAPPLLTILITKQTIPDRLQVSSPSGTERATDLDLFPSKTKKKPHQPPALGPQLPSY